MELEKYITDPVLLKNQKFYQKRTLKNLSGHFKEYINFAFENKERLDFLCIAYGVLRGGMIKGTCRFKDLTGEEHRFLTSRKLWDFMEDIPAEQDPRAVTASVIESLLEKME